MGIPYTLGVGIHGPPGTGKTSFFKALANYTGRHIVNLSFKLINKKKQLQDFYFETRYNYNNQENDIGFDKKIIIFEDLDCAGDIFLDRNIKKKKLEERKIQEVLDTTQLLSNIAQSLEKPEMMGPIPKFNEDPITLDDILNLWDGLHETPGRIIAISSNHYDTLDPALIRPGRIDITLEMKLVNRETLKEMFLHFFDVYIEESDLNLFPENVYSPAEIVNIYISCKNDPDRFMEMLLLQSKKIENEK
jgi:chaperone BCS1